MTTRSRRVLTPVTITERYLNPRTGQMQAWAAKSDDGLWTYNRIEGVPGTPWETTYLPTGEDFWAPSLPYARCATADGSALAYMEARRQQEGASR